MKKPPQQAELFDSVLSCAQVLFGELSESAVSQCGRLVSVVDDKGRYLHWDDLLKKTNQQQKAKAQWSLIKLARNAVLKTVPALGEALGPETLFTLLPTMQKTSSLIDRTCTEAGLSDLINRISIPDYYLHDLINEESIASSQLEGASTTRAAAKKMLAENRTPRTESEKMILGNRRLMTLAWASRSEAMSMSLLLEFHREATLGIDDARYRPGQIRTTDDVWVAGRDGDVVYTPPAATELAGMLALFIDWINYGHEAGEAPQYYLHPVIKACMIHFGLGYLHPFHDGNGRVARALCYWYLFKHGYDAFLYISLSQLLKEAPIQYGEAYLKTETDNQDVTYFVEYQCRVLERAVNGFFNHVPLSTRLRRH